MRPASVLRGEGSAQVPESSGQGLNLGLEYIGESTVLYVTAAHKRCPGMYECRVNDDGTVISAGAVLEAATADVALAAALSSPSRVCPRA